MNKLILIFSAIILFPSNFYAMANLSTFAHTVDLTNPANFTSCVPSFTHDTTDLNSPFYQQEQSDCIAQIKGAKEIINQYKNFNNIYNNLQSNTIKNQEAFIEKISAFHDLAQREIMGVKSYDSLINNQELLQAANMHPESPSVTFLLLAQEYISSQHALTLSEKWAIFNRIKPLLGVSYSNMNNLEDLSKVLSTIYDSSWNNHKYLITSRLLNISTIAKLQQEINTTKLAAIRKVQHLLCEQESQYEKALQSFNQTPIHATTADIEVIRDVVSHTNIENAELTTQTKITPPIINKAVPSAQKKANNLSAKQKTALLQAQQRAEQSKIDKEKHLLALQKEQDNKKLIVATQMLIPLPAKDNSNIATKKPKKTKTQQKVFDEDYEAINKAIETNNNDFADIFLENLNPALANQAISDSIVATELIENEQLMQSKEFVQFSEFISRRNDEFNNLAQNKELQRIANLKLLCKAKKQDRDSLKRKLEIELERNFSPMSEDEKSTAPLLLYYEKTIDMESSIDVISLEHFKEITDKIAAADAYLINRGSKLKWYLALDLDLYKRIKTKFLQFKTAINSVIAEYIASGNKMPSTSPLEKQMRMLEILEKFHLNDGIFDLSDILYEIKTNEEINKLGSLTLATLEQAQLDIKSLYAGKNYINFLLIRPIVIDLFNKIDVTVSSKNLDETINSLSKIAMTKKFKSEEEFHAFMDNQERTVFHTLQRSSEMNMQPYTEDHVADITKIHMTILATLIDIIKV